MKTNYHQFCTALLVVTVSGFIMSLTGCATVMTGKYQSISVTSDPPGVKVRADTGETIVTPGKFNLMRNEVHTLMAECPGYEPQQLKLHNKAQGWVWGNILLGGPVGLIVDCVSGASDELIPKEIHFNFANPQLTTREATKIKEKDKKAAELNAPITKSPTVIQCENCGHEIGRLEKAYLYEGHVVCSQCYLKLKQQP
jgi:predicted RNA-binding Zn-ribbon protein involved in translation (DUF1610 family)